MVQSDRYYKSCTVGVTSEVGLTTDRDLSVPTCLRNTSFIPPRYQKSRGASHYTRHAIVRFQLIAILVSNFTYFPHSKVLLFRADVLLVYLFINWDFDVSLQNLYFIHIRWFLSTFYCCCCYFGFFISCLCRQLNCTILLFIVVILRILPFGDLYICQIW